MSSIDNYDIFDGSWDGFLDYLMYEDLLDSEDINELNEEFQYEREHTKWTNKWINKWLDDGELDIICGPLMKEYNLEDAWYNYRTKSNYVVGELSYY